MTEIAIGECRLINGGCMEFMRTLPDKAFSLAIADPPYGDGGKWLRRDDTGFGGMFGRYKGSEPCLRGQVQQVSGGRGPFSASLPSAPQTEGTWAAKYATDIRAWDVPPTEEYCSQ